MKVKGCYVLLIIIVLSLLGCASLPEQPATSSPYAMLSFPTTIQLLALDAQHFDLRFPVNSLRVSPGQHTLQFVYVATGPSSSTTHHGQHAAPFMLEVQEGMIYYFVAKTWGIIWRPEVASTTAIPGYCQTHTCTAVALQPVQDPQGKDCH